MQPNVTPMESLSAVAWPQSPIPKHPALLGREEAQELGMKSWTGDWEEVEGGVLGFVFVSHYPTLVLSGNKSK